MLSSRPSGLCIDNNPSYIRIYSGKNCNHECSDKINKSLEQWGKSHPTIKGKKLIVQMIIAGMTQHLTEAQGMLQEV